MLESILNTNITNTTLTMQTILLSLGMGLLLGAMISFTYIKTNDDSFSEHFIIALLLLPVLMSSVILLIGSNVAGAFSLAGIFSVIRFRSAPGSAKDIVYILFCVGAGLACGIEAYSFGMIFTILLCAVLFIISHIPIWGKNNMYMQLKILVPEDLNDENTFDDILQKYTKKYSLDQMRTKDLGSIYEFNYSIIIPQDINKKEFLDYLRCRNGNLNISLKLGAKNTEF